MWFIDCSSVHINYNCLQELHACVHSCTHPLCLSQLINLGLRKLFPKFYLLFYSFIPNGFTYYMCIPKQPRNILNVTTYWSCHIHIMIVFALGVPRLVKLMFLNLMVAFMRISSLHVVQNSKHSYTFIRKLFHFGV